MRPFIESNRIERILSLIGKKRTALLISLWMLLMPFPIGGQQPEDFDGALDPIRERIEIFSDQLELYLKESKAIYTGKVVVVQKDYRLECGRLEVLWDSEARKIAKVSAFEGVNLDTEEGRVTSDEASWDVATRSIVMTGSPKLVKGMNSIEGGKIVYSIDEGRSTILGGKDGRVRTRITPGELKPGDLKQ